MKFLTKWKIKSPFALSFDEWDKWNAETKAAYPIRWFLQHTISDLFSKWITVPIGWRIKNFYWGLKYRFIKKHQYHIIRPRTLKPNYHDNDNRLLHGIMECFVDFFETSAKHVNWETSSEEHKQTYSDMKEIYVWWTNKKSKVKNLTVSGEKLEEYPTFPKQWGTMAVLKQKYKHEPLMGKWEEVSKKHRKSDKEWEDLETEMLIRIIKIRKFMWD